VESEKTLFNPIPTLFREPILGVFLNLRILGFDARILNQSPNQPLNHTLVVCYICVRVVFVWVSVLASLCCVRVT
jgi:hypothetical protein